MASESSNLGLYIVGQATTPSQSEFSAFFNVIGRDRKEFDAQVELFKRLNQDFDAKVIVYTDELKPDVTITSPSIPVTSGSAGVTIQFDADASGLNGKHISYYSWFFSDVPVTSGATVVGNTYSTTHTFALSGVFDAVFVVIDNNGVVNADRVKIDTTSGVAVQQIELNATPESGTAPLSVAFSGVVSSTPFPIVDSSLSFGDGTMSASTISIYKLYPVIGCYIPVFRTRDSRGMIVTDTTVVGVNN